MNAASYTFPDRLSNLAPVRIVVFYHDLEAGRQSRRLLQVIEEESLEPHELEMTFWRHDILILDEARREAETDLATADLVIFAAPEKALELTPSLPWIARRLSDADSPAIIRLASDRPLDFSATVFSPHFN
jgi:hypothetical protein